MTRNIRVAGEGSYQESRNRSRRVSEQSFSCGKGWGNPSGDKFEKTQHIYPLRALQNRRFALPEISSGKKRFPVQDGSQRPLLCNSSQQTVIKICEIQVVRQPLRVFLPLFWFRASSKGFPQITKNPNCSFETINIRIIVYRDDMLMMGRTLQEIMTTRDTLIFLLQSLGFVISLTKSILQPAKQLEFLGLQINTEVMTLSLSGEKLTHIIEQCQAVYSQPRTSVLKVQPCKLYISKYRITSTQTINTEIFAFIAVLVFKLLSRKVLFINRRDSRKLLKKVGYFLRK